MDKARLNFRDGRQYQRHSVGTRRIIDSQYRVITTNSNNNYNNN